MTKAVANRQPPADAAATPDRHDHQLGLGLLILEHFERGRADPGDQIRLIARRHESHPGRVGVRRRRAHRVVEPLARLVDLGPEPLDRGELVGIRAFRHEDRRPHTVHATGVGDRLTVVPRRSRHQPGCSLVLAQAGEQRQPAAHLERAHRRRELELQRYLRVEQL